MIRVEDEGELRIITLDRPDKANALTPEMLKELARAAEDALSSRALILTGTGSVFSAGADLESAKAGMAVSPHWERLSHVLSRHKGLTIAALNGTVAGGAMGMALACDLRIGVATAKFFYPVMKLGFLPQPSDPARLSALVGPARARLILMAGAKVTADEALSWGLLERIVAPDALLDEARALAADTLAAKPEHAFAIKSLTR